MSEEFTIPQDVFIFKLAKALQMEHDMMEDLGTFQKAVQSREVKDFFKNHEKETKEQIKRLERCFELLDKPATPPAVPNRNRDPPGSRHRHPEDQQGAC